MGQHFGVFYLLDKVKHLQDLIIFDLAGKTTENVFFFVIEFVKSFDGFFADIGDLPFLVEALFLLEQELLLFEFFWVEEVTD